MAAQQGTVGFAGVLTAARSECTIRPAGGWRCVMAICKADAITSSAGMFGAMARADNLA